MGVALRLLEEVNHLHHLLLGTIEAGNVVKGGLHLCLRVKELSLGLADIHHTATTAHTGEAPHHPDPENDQEEEG